MASEKRLGNSRRPLKLSPELSDIVGKEVASRQNIISRVKRYVKANNLQDPENKQFFIPDKKLAKVFGTLSVKTLNIRLYIGDDVTIIDPEESAEKTGSFN